MINSKPLTTLLSIALLVNVVCAGLYGGAWYLMDQKSAHIGEMKELVAGEAQREGVRHELAYLISHTEADRERVNGYFVSEENFISFIGGVEDLAKDAGVKLVDSNLLANKELSLTYQVEGSFSNIMYFTGLLESLPYNAYIDNVYVDAPKNENDKKWRGKIRFVVESFIESENG